MIPLSSFDPAFAVPQIVVLSVAAIALTVWFYRDAARPGNRSRAAAKVAIVARVIGLTLILMILMNPTQMRGRNSVDESPEPVSRPARFDAAFRAEADRVQRLVTVSEAVRQPLAPGVGPEAVPAPRLTAKPLGRSVTLVRSSGRGASEPCVWDRGWLLALILGAFALEWAFRRPTS
jgi:hypothetical protein